jgi:hypothetical protein
MWLNVSRGAMPMGLATIITMLVYVAVPLSPGFLYLTQVLFWIDVVFSLMTCFGVPLYMSVPVRAPFSQSLIITYLPDRSLFLDCLSF